MKGCGMKRRAELKPNLEAIAVAYSIFKVLDSNQATKRNLTTNFKLSLVKRYRTYELGEGSVHVLVSIASSKIHGPRRPYLTLIKDEAFSEYSSFALFRTLNLGDSLPDALSQRFMDSVFEGSQFAPFQTMITGVDIVEVWGEGRSIKADLKIEFDFKVPLTVG
jgi:hypothetical protein